MEGWIKLHRSILDWEWWEDQSCFRLFIFCLLKANTEDKTWRGEIIKRGSFITSLENISSGTGLTNQMIRTALAKLEKTGEISKKSTNKYSIVTINKYDSYQVFDTIKQQTNNKQSTNNQQTTNKQATTTKEYKEEKNNNITPPSACACTCEEGKPEAEIILEGIRDFLESKGMQYYPNWSYQTTDCTTIASHLRKTYNGSFTAEQWQDFLAKAWNNGDSFIREHFNLRYIADNFGLLFNRTSAAKKNTLPDGRSLGPGEYFTSDGRRTYGDGRANIPLCAPPRPTKRYYWDAASQSWNT